MLFGRIKRQTRQSVCRYEEHSGYESEYARRELCWTRIGLLACSFLLAVLVITIVEAPCTGSIKVSCNCKQ